MANPWFRMYAEFATDQKVQMLSEVDQRRLTMLFCLRCNDNVTLHDDEVTFLLRISNDDWMRTKAVFIAKGFINSDNEILNWDKRQFASDTSKNRVAAHRERKKKQSNNDVTLQVTKSNVLDTDTDTDTDTEKTNTVEAGNIPQAQTENHSTLAGQVCVSLKNIGVTGLNPSNPTLIALVSAGATLDEFINAADSASVKKFAYVLAVVKGQREEAASLNIRKGAMPISDRKIQQQGVANSIFGGSGQKLTEVEVYDAA